MSGFATVDVVEGRPRLAPSYSPRTVPELLARRAEADPDGIAVAGFTESGEDLERLGFAELRERSMALASRLLELGLDEGGAVAWLADNSNGLEGLVLHHAIAAAGGVGVPVNPRLASPEVASILARAEARLVVHSRAAQPRAAEAVEMVAARPTVVSLSELYGAGAMAGHLAAVAERSARLRPREPAVILFTSGTTGTSKGVVHSHETAIAAAIGWADAMRLARGDLLQSPYPVFSGAALHFNGLACLWAGAGYAIDQADVAGMLARVEELGSTVFVAVPAIYQFWLAEPGFADRRLGSLRLLDYGGAAMPPSVIERLREALSGVALLQTYGLTEAGPGGTYLPEEYAVSKLGSIGNRGAGGLEFRVLDAHDEDVGPDGEGELVVRGPATMLGYHADPGATAAVLSSDGWLRTGDIVRADADGFLFFVDRNKDIIVRGGYNIGSLEVEGALCSHPEVLEAAAVGVPHPRLGEQVAAFVVRRHDSALSAAELLEHCRPLLADFKLPSRIELRTELPRNAAGKVLKGALREEG
ncbi:MAG TPA: class I adenylate-forming enzyme family protein [Solirubrobacterales bacterium]|nr:class I adenylate-forming enzyme family protein [Solirubrobacterales bacterium]